MENVEIRDVTPKQKAILDQLWNLDSNEDFEYFVSKLPFAEQREVATLCIMLKHAYDEKEIEKMTSYPYATALFDKLRNSK